MNPLRLQYRLALATFLPLVIFAILSVSLGVYALRRIPEELVLQRQTALTQMTAAGVAGNLRGYVRLLESIATEAAAHTGDENAEQALLTERADLLGVFSGGAVILDQRGNAVAGTEYAQASLGLNYSYRPYFDQVKRSLSPAFSTVLQDQPAGFNAVVIAVPILKQDTFSGVLLGELALNNAEWARDLSLLRTAQGGLAYLVDSSGVILYHPDASRIGTPAGGRVLLDLVTSHQAASLIDTPPSGPAAVISYAPIPGVTWGVLTEEPRDAILAPMAPYALLLGLSMIAGLVLALGALLISVQRVTRPLGALIAEGERVAAGETFRPVPVQGPPDLRTLVEVVNRMVRRLAEQQAALREYARQVVRSQEDERLRLSRELHDETVQDLVGLQQRLELSGDLLDDGDTAAARRELAESQELALRTVDEVRRISHNLRPAVLQDRGLVAGVQLLVRELAEQMPNARVQCDFLGTEVRLAPEVELSAFRIAQEALTNIRKHAPAATRVSVALVYEPESLTLVVEDDGPGFPSDGRAALVREGHLGLAGMQERAALFGGRLEITSDADGTRVMLHLPTSEGTPTSVSRSE